jgi:hypothetical protein
MASLDTVAWIIAFRRGHKQRDRINGISSYWSSILGEFFKELSRCLWSIVIYNSH